MKIIRGALLLGTLMLGTQSVQAAPVPGLFQIQVSASEGQDAGVSGAAQERAFSLLLKRLTGDAGSVRHPELQARMGNLQNLILGQSEQGGALQVNFDPAAVMQLLHDSSLPAWGVERPVLLLWWVQEGALGNQLLSDGQVLSQRVLQAAYGNGLLVRFPLGDLGEQTSLDQSPQVGELLERYQADGLLLLRSTEGDGQVEARWELLGLLEDRQGSVSAASQSVVADRVLADVTRQLVADFAVQPGRDLEFRVHVGGVQIDSLMAVEKALQIFSPRLLSLGQGTGVWQVTGQPALLRQQMSQAGFMEQGNNDHDDGGQGDNGASELFFAWQ